MFVTSEGSQIVVGKTDDTSLVEKIDKTSRTIPSDIPKTSWKEYAFHLASAFGPDRLVLVQPEGRLCSHRIPKMSSDAIQAIEYGFDEGFYQIACNYNRKIATEFMWWFKTTRDYEFDQLRRIFEEYLDFDQAIETFDRGCPDGKGFYDYVRESMNNVVDMIEMLDLPYSELAEYQGAVKIPRFAKIYPDDKFSELLYRSL